MRVLALMLVLAAVVPASAAAIVEVPFAARYSTNDHGAIWVTGSTLMTCPAADANCAASQAGTAAGAALNNNNFAMTPVDVDANPATFNSSSSTFAPPAGSDVLFAGLYFGGRVTAGGGGAPAPNAAARGSALLQTPTSGTYAPVTGTVSNSTAIAGAYVAAADVTDLVRAGGAGRYFVANVQSGTGLDRYAGWALVVVYRDPAQPLRNLTVFDGLAAIQQGDAPLTIGVSGFKTPVSGLVRTSVGIVAYEGDRGSAGDRLALNGQLLADAANPATNLFNSSVSFEGTNTLSQRIPAFVNGLGFDADRMVADGLLANGATSATFEASTTLDQYLMHVVTFTTDLSAPRLDLAKSVTDANGGDVEPGDVLRYTVTTRNLGDDAATGVSVQDAIPAGTRLVRGSLTGTGGAAAAGDRSVGFQLGTLDPGASALVSFDVVVDDDAAEGFVVANTASANGFGATAGQPVSATSPQVTSTVHRLPFTGGLTVTPSTPEAGEAVDATLTVTNKLDKPVEGVVVTLEVPGASLLSPRPPRGDRCSASGDHVRCTLGTLKAHEKATTRLRLRAHDSGRLRPVVSVRGKGVATRRIILRTLRVKPGKARLSVTKRADASFGRQGRSATYRIVVTAARAAATAHSVRVCDVPGVGLLLRAVSHGGTLRNGGACWQLGNLAPGQRRELRVVARVTAPAGVVRNTARAGAANLRGRASVVAVAGLRVAPRFAGACTAATGGPIAHASC